MQYDQDVIADIAKDRGVNPAESPYDCILEVDTDEHQAVIVWREPLKFHAELSQLDQERFGSSYRGVPWSKLTDESGYLTGESEAILNAELVRLIAKAGVTVTVYEGQPSDEPEWAFEVVSSYEPGETYESWFDRAGWPIVATIINATDPGTFNFPYVFSSILYQDRG